MTRATKISFRGVRRDPYYRKILEGLERKDLSEELFESCVADLLRDSFPGLVPVPGGNDAGMDGAIAAADGEPFPLVTTASEDPERNLRRNLEAFLRRDTQTRKVAFATSRKLTPAKRRRLMELARKKGFTMLQVIEQRGIADRLYRDSRWARDLLGVAGTPPALSAVPSTRRPLLEIEPVGRERDIEWVKTGMGDRVLVGQPGAGKTFLLHWLARHRWDALFLRATSETEIANALRDLAPKVVIVDDAHARLEELRKLAGLRHELGFLFEIVATTWEGARDRVLAELSLHEEQSHKLELLTRREILAIYEAMGIPALVRETERDAFMRELIDQADRKPGLAVTIGTLWLQGGRQEIVRGEALSRETLRFFEQTVGADSAAVLGCFSLGGKRGMSLEAVREILGINRSQIWRIVTDLSAGGVLRDLREGVLAVEPEPLRSALLRRTFFPDQGPPLTDYRRALGVVASREHAVDALLRARGRGVAVADPDLRELVAASTERHLWEGLASLSRENALWVLAKYPGDVVDIARGALSAAASAVLPRLLSAPRRDAVMSLLSTWTMEQTTVEEAISRRRLLAYATRDYLADAGDLSIGTEAIFLALSPAVGRLDLDPAMGNEVTMHWGLLPVWGLRCIESIWADVRGCITRLDQGTWTSIRNNLWNWLFPQCIARGLPVPDEQRELMRNFAATVLTDLSRLASDSPGLAAAVTRLAAIIDLDLTLPLDPIFELLYPPHDHSLEERMASDAYQEKKLESLAIEWSKRPPIEIAESVFFYEREAEKARCKSPGNTHLLSHLIASAITEPHKWLDAFLDHGLSEPWVSAFLARLGEIRPGAWEMRAERCLALSQTSWAATWLVLTMNEPPPSLLRSALERATKWPSLIETVCLQRRVPLSTLELLLRLPWEAALAAAVGEWRSDPKGEVRRAVREEWQAAILKAATSDCVISDDVCYGLLEILSRNPHLALQWLRAQLGAPAAPHHFGHEIYLIAVTSAQALDPISKIQLLREVQSSSLVGSLIPTLVGHDAVLFEHLLTLGLHAKYALKPLEGKPNERWRALAEVALRAGYHPEKVAEASLRGWFDNVQVGSGLEQWLSWDEAFAALETDPLFQEVARYARRRAGEQIELARKEQKEMEMQGLHRT